MKKAILLSLLLFVSGRQLMAQVYKAEWSSLDTRPIPGWFEDAKFGIFVHWGVYSVPAYRPLESGLFASYSEWYYAKVFDNQKNGGKDFHIKNYGKDFEYRDFAPLFRAELWQPDIPAVDNDGNFHSITVNFKKINWVQNLVDTRIEDIWKEAPATVQEYYKQWLLHMSKEAIITDLSADIIMLKDFCLQNNIKILIWSNTQLWPKEPEVAISDVFLKDFTKILLNSDCIIDPWKFSFQQFALDQGHRPKDEDVYGISGHPSVAAHVDFANYLIEYLKEKEIR
jgi:hypothetical protein